MWYQVNLARVIAYSVLSVVTVAATLVLVSYISQQKSEQPERFVVSAPVPVECKEFASILGTKNVKVFCERGILETQELQSGNVLVVCRCDDPVSSSVESSKEKSTSE